MPIQCTVGRLKISRKEVSMKIGGADAQLAATAASAVTTVPDLRQGKVDAARKALEAGRIGQDPFSLAEKLIDSLLGACND